MNREGTRRAGMVAAQGPAHATLDLFSHGSSCVFRKEENTLPTNRAAQIVVGLGKQAGNRHWNTPVKAIPASTIPTLLPALSEQNPPRGPHGCIFCR